MLMLCGMAAEIDLPPIRAAARTDTNSRIAHEQLVEKAKKGGIDVYFVGDSITRRWGATDPQYRELLQNWTTNFFGWNAANFGWGADRIENILWRLENGELDRVNPRIIVLLAGINNVGTDPGGPEKARYVAGRVRTLVDVCRQKAPDATIVVTAIFPRNDNMAVIPVITEANRRIAEIADGRKVRFLDINRKLADDNGKFFEGMVNADQLHPTLKIYQVWADALKPIFTEILGPPAATGHAPPPTGDPSATKTQVPAKAAESLTDEKASSPSSPLHVGAAAAEFEADDTMVIAGGITAGKATGQEGKLRAVAVVLELPPFGKLAIVACDVLMVTREHLDPVAREIEETTGIPFANILVNCTHTHHAPSTMVLHGYGLDEIFVKRVQRGIVKAVQEANANLSKDNCRFYFALGEEKTVVQNSRQLLADGQIYWIGPRTNFVRATGPFDAELPVMAFRDSADKLKALIFNHSTHTIGTRKPGLRSPSFYGLAAQELETELGGTFCFLEGASGSTHNLDLSGDEATRRMKQAVIDALAQSTVRPVARLAAIKRPFKFRVRNFDAASEDEAVSRYCRKYAGTYAETVIQVFRDMRKTLAPQRGQDRQTWLQVLLIGDVAIAGVPAEYFTQLGLDIKNRSPFRHTYIAELANDWIGYLPNLEAHKLGGYQVWTGYHSYAEPGTGERIADEIVAMLKELQR